MAPALYKLKLRHGTINIHQLPVESPEVQAKTLRSFLSLNMTLATSSKQQTMMLESMQPVPSFEPTPRDWPEGKHSHGLPMTLAFD